MDTHKKLTRALALSHRMQQDVPHPNHNGSLRWAGNTLTSINSQTPSGDRQTMGSSTRLTSHPRLPKTFHVVYFVIS